MASLFKKTKPFIMLALAALMLLAGCQKTGQTGPTTMPVVTQSPEVEYSIVKLACYWPEDAGPDDCVYSLYVEKPEFSQAFTAGYALNRAVDDYITKLTDRIESSYIPASAVKSPYTRVTCSVEHVGAYTNIIFTESENYEVQPYTETYVLMLDERGSELNLCDVFLNYHAETLVAERIGKIIEGDSRYFTTDTARIIGALDIAHGAKITPSGATVYIREGKLAPYEEGELSFEIKSADICPDFVGEGKAISYVEYCALTDFLGMISNAAIIRGDDIEDGQLSAYAATGFMAQAAQNSMNIVPQAGRINVPEEDFINYYTACFGTDFPGIDTEAHDIKQQKGSYSVLNKKLEFTYYVDMLSAEMQDDALVITGDITFGSFGYAFTTPVCHVTVRLIRSETAPFGFVLQLFDMNL